MRKIKRYIFPLGLLLAAAGIFVALASQASLFPQFLLMLLFLTLGGTSFFLNQQATEAKKELLRGAQTHSVLLNSLAEGVIVHDEHFVIKDLNDNAEKMIGLKKEEILGIEVTPDMLGAQKTRVLAQITYPTIGGTILERKTKGNIEYLEVYFEEPSPAYFRVGIGKIVDEEKNVVGYFRIFIDRTAEVLSFQNQAEFLSVAAHQMRTPLTQIRWVLEVLKDSAADKDLIEKGLEVLTKTLVSIDAILSMVKIEGRGLAIVIETNDINKVILEAVEGLKISFAISGIKYKYEVINEIVPFKFDKQKIYQVLLSLLDNAIRYNKPGGMVTIRLGRVPDRPYAEISISDTGIGIPAKELPFLFQKFYRGSNVKGTGVSGFGIGLYIAKKIVEAHGGSLKVGSKENEGTTVTLTLPLQESLIPT